MQHQFRTALNGFNRSDVVTYLQNMMEAHKSAMLNAQNAEKRAKDEGDRLRRENAQLHADLEKERAALGHRKAELDQLKNELMKLITVNQEEKHQIRLLKGRHKA